jgi:hypothetical protein
MSPLDVKGEITNLGKKTVLSESDEVSESKALVKLLLLKLGEGTILWTI